MEILLASSSPRRRQLLAQLGLTFTIRAADIDETMDPDRRPSEEVGRISAQKAAAVAAEPETIVIAADTIVCMDGRILGKPKTEDEAFAMLKNLAGRSHEVLTGLTVPAGQPLSHPGRAHQGPVPALPGRGAARLHRHGRAHGQGGRVRHPGAGVHLCRAHRGRLLQCGGAAPLHTGPDAGAVRGISAEVKR